MNQMNMTVSSCCYWGEDDRRYTAGSVEQTLLLSDLVGAETPLQGPNLNSQTYLMRLCPQWAYATVWNII